jgi:hypothetical protein
MFDNSGYMIRLIDMLRSLTLATIVCLLPTCTFAVRSAKKRKAHPIAKAKLQAPAPGARSLRAKNRRHSFRSHGGR